jgi:hypothetical protein
MPFEHALWKIGGTLARLAPATIGDERALEGYINTDIRILSDRWMLIGRQVHTDYGKFIDPHTPSKKVRHASRHLEATT